MVGTILNKRVTARLALQDSRFMEQEVEFSDFAEFGEDLEEGVPNKNVDND